ncbi:MAG: tetratricopeptide repeat protein [Thermoanaerobaculales bacterium]|nr:tetratricopeptide repeat protein [Thermoanaerobaculales bacterium]
MAINRDKILKGAEKLVQKGKIEQAIREYEKLLKLNPNDVNTINRVGDLYNRIGQTDRAVELYERIADAFAADGFANKAIAIYKKINRLVPDRVEIFERLADLYIQQGLIFEAQNQYQDLADWFVKNEDFESGIKTLRKLVQIDADNHMAHLRLADLLFRLGASDEAVGVYERLGTMLLSRGKVDEAERLFRHAVEQDPPTGEFLIPICEALVENGNIASARDFIAEGLKKSADSAPLKVLSLRVSLATGETEKGLAAAKQLLEDSPDDSEVQCLAGKALLAGGEGAEGCALLAPLARRMIDKGDRAGAQGIFQSLIKAMPQEREVLDLGIKVLDENEDQEMVFTLRAALADNFFRSGDSGQARDLYRELLQEEPENSLFTQRIQELDGEPSVSVGVQQMPVEAAPPIVEVPSEIEFEDLSSESQAVEFDIPDDAPGVVTDVPEVSSPEVLPPEALPPEVSSPEVMPPVEAVSPPADFDPQERLAEANVFAKYGLIDKALLHLEKILEVFPNELEAREKLVFLAIEAERPDLAVREAASLVEEYRQGDKTEALEALGRALPQLGLQVAADVGPAPVAEEESIELPVEEFEILEAEDEFVAVPASELEDLSDFGEELELTEAEDEVERFEAEIEAEPFASPNGDTVELDEIEFESVEFEERAAIEPTNGLEFEDVDPGEFTETSAPVAEPNVSIEMEPSAAEKVEGVGPISADILGELADLEESVLGGGRGLGVVETTKEREVQVARPTLQEPMVLKPLGDRVGVDSGAVEPVRDAPGPPLKDIKQLDSFVEASLYEDANRLLSELEREYADHAELVKRRLELKSKGFLIEVVPTAVEASEDLFADEVEDYVDLAAELEEEMAAEEAIVDEAAGGQAGEVELEQVFREFQKGVAQQLSEEDSDTHFNLGIAYKEMGLLPEAIREFQIASRDSSFFVECCSMIGVCYVEQGMWDQAAPWYGKALAAPDLSPESMIALKYDLADVLEGSGDYGGAVELFEEILAINPAFRNVSVRLTDLGSQQYAN